MPSNYLKLHEKEYDKLMEKYEASQQQIKELKELNRDLKDMVSSMKDIKDTLNEVKELNTKLNNKIDDLTNQLKEKDEENQKLLDEIQRLKNNNKKDSSNSSKPSSTNGSKKIPNNREKSNRKQGGQKGHKAHTLKVKDVEKLIEDKTNTKYVVNNVNDITVTLPKYVIDLTFEVTVTENKGCKIDKLNEVVYGNNIKSLIILLVTNNYMSYDQIVSLISSMTDNKINLSKGTLVKWINEFSLSLDNELEAIDNDLLDGHCMNVDDSNMKIDGDNANQLCACNQQSVHLYASNSKSREAWAETIISKFIGVFVKDGTRVFDNTLNEKAQCLIHIIRYLKGAYEFSDGKHKTTRKLINFFKGLNEHRNKLINEGIMSFTTEQIKRYEDRFNELITEWEKELEGESENIYKEEINLFNRMKGKDKDEILFFIHDFKIPFTNNNAESAQRGLKIKQKIGKFRSTEGANNYCRIKSFILTLKKRGLSIFNSIKSINLGQTVLA